MEIKLRSVTQVLIGLHRVGLVGLEPAIEQAEAAGLEDREDLLDVMMEALTPLNYIPQSAKEDYRQTVWREYRRHRGEDIRDLYSKIEVDVRGEPGDEVDRLVETLTAVLGEHELQPVVNYQPPTSATHLPQLLIAGKLVVEGKTREADIKKAISRQISDW
jgi:hypothetical protein